MHKVWTFHSEILMQLHKWAEIQKTNEKRNLIYTAIHHSNQEFAQDVLL